MFVVVDVELPQTLEDDRISVRSARGRRTVSHHWCMCVVSYGYGGWGRDGGGGWYACGTKGAGRMPGDAIALPDSEVKTVMTTDHTAIQVRSSGLGRA